MQIAFQTGCRCGVVAAVMLAAVFAQRTDAAAPVVSNPVIVTCTNTWTYKDGAKNDKFSGKHITPSLVPYLANGWGISIVRVEGSNYFIFTPSYQLVTKNSNTWSLNIKNVITMKYSAKNGTFSCTVWTQLPPAWAVHVGSTDMFVVVDLSGGPGASNYPVTCLGSLPVLDDSYKTTKMLLRRIPAGTFFMGSSNKELGRNDDENKHEVTLTRDFYMGVFHVTQAQYTNVTGLNPSYHFGEMRPVENVSWQQVRGGTWPGGTPSSSTFIGLLRTKTGLAFELPTEAQWEYACRAGTGTALNNGRNLQSQDQDANMDILGRYWYNGGNGSNHCVVGSYVPNNWDLYDMHGNVSAWCLDWRQDYHGKETDPMGPATGSERAIRGGAWNFYACGCRSAFRNFYGPANYCPSQGLRVVITIGP